MSDMSGFREKMFQNAMVHGGAGNMAAPVGKPADAPSKVFEAAVQKGAVDKDDDLVAGLFELFTPEARTTEGRERALKMATAIAKFIRTRFEVRKIS